VTPSEFDTIRYEVADGVAVVTLNRPDSGNAWIGPMAVEYRWALHRADTDPDVRVVVLTGAGRSFCVGAGTEALGAIGERGGSYERERRPLPPFPEGTPPALRHNHAAPLSLGTPVIAAINGGCAGAGFVLATYADLRWAAASARFATAFAGLGLPAEYGLGWMLPRITGSASALELLWDPTPRTADEAAQLGFVQRVVADDALLEEATSFARVLARHSSPASLRAMKRAVWVDAVGTLDDAYRRSVQDMELAMTGEDFRLGVAAARAKRRPDFLSGGPEP
jgi:enoyl-CoA hydratase/carnithine racemase